MINEWDLSSTNLDRASRRKYEVAVLPTGATEPHNRHLPEGLDVIHATHVARAACERAWGRCESVVCLPPLPYGVDCNLESFPLAVHVSQAVLDAMVRDIIGSLRRQGIRKVVIINGHGGNDFSPLVRQVQCDLDSFVFLCDWWKVGFDRYDEIFDRPDDHAGQMETSVAMALCPELVEAAKAGSGRGAPFRFEALRKGYLRTSRDFARLNDHCANGDPTGSTADKGRKYLEIAIGRIADFLVELAGSPIDAKFPME
jgi:creatinine amidohydrolase